MKAENKADIENPLVALKSLLRADLDKVDELIYSLIISKISLIPQISEHTISAGGKRLRPLLTLASANMCGYKGDAHIDLAACVEFIHTATLLHDDVVDKSDLRRGESTANSLWGNKESILVGDYLLGKGFQLMGAASSLDVYRVLSSAAVVISEGEVMQLAATGDIEQGTKNYINIIAAKTAELFSASCEVGGIIACSDKATISALRDYGMNLGIAFQIIDDKLDYSSLSSQMGKQVGDDLKERKVTLPVILSYQASDYSEKTFWERVINEGEQSDTDIETALQIINKYKITEKVQQEAEKYAAKAKASLSVLEECEIKKCLLDIADFAVVRKF